MNIFGESVGGGLIEDNGVLSLVLDYIDISSVSIRILMVEFIAHPFPWTTSSFASLRRCLLEPFCRIDVVVKNGCFSQNQFNRGGLIFEFRACVCRVEKNTLVLM